jgi:organic hydroperoxide reductase OsmC/OhrA
MATHTYDVEVRWTGNLGAGTADYRSYSRDHEVTEGSKLLRGSSDPAFRGDAERWNPEQLLVASLSQCHLLWYLHLAAESGVRVVDYEDRAHGVMTEDGALGGQFVRVVLTPVVTISGDSDAALAEELHARVHALCFIARSVSFPVEVEPVVVRAAQSADPASTDPASTGTTDRA